MGAHIGNNIVSQRQTGFYNYNLYLLTASSRIWQRSGSSVTGEVGLEGRPEEEGRAGVTACRSRVRPVGVRRPAAGGSLSLPPTTSRPGRAGFSSQLTLATHTPAARIPPPTIHHQKVKQLTRSMLCVVAVKWGLLLRQARLEHTDSG